MLISAPAMVLNQANIDTDQIIPARFLTTTERKGLGKHAFFDWRYDANGELRAEFPLNKSQVERVLIAGKNFGCGSSREHAPWALLDAGIRAVIATEIADIFRGNSLKNGLLACVIDAQAHQALLAEIEADANAKIGVDVAAAEVIFPSGRRVNFPIDAFAQHCILQGVDELGFLLKLSPQLEAFEATRAHTRLPATHAAHS